jgi:acyl-CoA thioester hydrolase
MRKVEFEEQVYTYQIDFSRHLSNIVYIQWMENGRLRLLEAVGLPAHKTAESNIVPVLTDTEISYKRQVFLGERVRVELFLSELRNASVWMEFRFYNGKDELVATGRQRGLFMSLETMRPQRLSAVQRAAFEPYLHVPSPLVGEG